MLDQLICYKCKASTVLEAIVAALILLISFSAGVVIYTKVLLSANSSGGIRASYSQKALADSLVAAGNIQPAQFSRGEMVFQVSLEAYPGSGGLQRLQITTINRSGKKLAELHRLIFSSHE